MGIHYFLCLKCECMGLNKICDKGEEKEKDKGWLEKMGSVRVIFFTEICVPKKVGFCEFCLCLCLVWFSVCVSGESCKCRQNDERTTSKR